MAPSPWGPPSRPNQKHNPTHTRTHTYSSSPVLFYSTHPRLKVCLSYFSHLFSVFLMRLCAVKVGICDGWDEGICVLSPASTPAHIPHTPVESLLCE